MQKIIIFLLFEEKAALNKSDCNTNYPFFSKTNKITFESKNIAASTFCAPSITTK